MAATRALAQRRPSSTARAGGRLSFRASAVVVVVADRSHRAGMSFFVGHTDDVTALAMHPNGHFFASGSAGFHPKALIFDVEHLEPNSSSDESLGHPRASCSSAQLRHAHWPFVV